MTKLSLTVACWDYDRTRALMDGRVAIEGCDINYIPLPPEELFFRAFRHQKFDVSELSLSTYTLQRSRGAAHYSAIPVFVSRSFRHSALYRRTDRGIDTPQDLKGRKVGVPEYQVTAAVWVRGILHDEYGVAPEDISWVTGGLEEPGGEEKVPFQPPAGVPVAHAPQGKTLSGMLAAGELDALVCYRPPSCYLRGDPAVGRMFEDYRRAEQSYYQKTGIFPIMHVIGIRNTLLEAYPWLAASVFKAFLEAKELSVRELSVLNALKITLPWVEAETKATMALMGEDFWPYGVPGNEKTLAAFLRYAHQQGITASEVAIEDLFVPSTLERHVV
ncbi:MAG: ABC transporter substrate-binding protein [bacterium]